MFMNRISLALTLLFTALPVQAVVRKHAVLIGIADYSASHIAGPARPVPPSRDWPELLGPLNDVDAMSNVLVSLYGFDDIMILRNEQATHDAILRAIDELVRRSAKGDVTFFYFGGHGSQVRNSLSDEPDKLDESIVPADSCKGAPDIRDKELRRRFNAILDRGAKLTVMLDNCHSGSGARGLPTGAIARGIRPDLRDVADRSIAGPLPESRGALILAATEDTDAAWEKQDDQKKFHGVFSWAWLRAVRDAAPGEPAIETFLRAQARMRGETPFQSPVIAGNTDARISPFLGVRKDRRDDRIVVAVESVKPGGIVQLNGGWVNGLSVGTELQPVGGPTSRIRITNMLGLARSEAHASGAIKPGMLLEVVAWYAPPARPLRVWTPSVASSPNELGRKLHAAALNRGIRWINDPVDITPAYTLRPASNGWELLGNGAIHHVDDPIAAIAKLPANTSLFVQFPAPAALIRDLALGEIATQTERAEDADYILAGRYTARGISYAWVRPLTKRSDRRACGMPLRSSWLMRNTAAKLRDAVIRLRRIQLWTQLDSPPEGRSPYRLALRRVADDRLVHEPILNGGSQYELVLRLTPGAHPPVQPRYFYAFAIDSFGKSVLICPRDTGSVENRYPLNANVPPVEIAFGKPFDVTPPYGTDTYFLISAEEPLPNPWIVEWDGVRTRSPESPTVLEKILMLDQTRGYLTPPDWSIERVVFESVAARRK